MALNEEAAVKAILQFFAYHQVSAVDALGLLSVLAAYGIIRHPRDMQAALLCGFKQAVSEHLASMQAKIDRTAAAGRLQ